MTHQQRQRQAKQAYWRNVLAELAPYNGTNRQVG